MAKSKSSKPAARSLADLGNVVSLPTKTVRVPRVLEDLTAKPADEEGVLNQVFDAPDAVDFDSVNDAPVSLRLPAAVTISIPDAVQDAPVADETYETLDDSALALGDDDAEDMHYIVVIGTGDVLDGPFGSFGEAEAFLSVGLKKGTYLPDAEEIVSEAMLAQRDAKSEPGEDEADEADFFVETGVDIEQDRDEEFDDTTDLEQEGVHADELEHEAYITDLMERNNISLEEAEALFEDGVEAAHNQFDEAAADREADEEAAKNALVERLAEEHVKRYFPDIDDTGETAEVTELEAEALETLRVADPKADLEALRQRAEPHGDLLYSFDNGYITQGEFYTKLLMAEAQAGTGDHTFVVADAAGNVVEETPLAEAELTPTNVAKYDDMANAADDEGMDANMANLSREAALAEIRRFHALSHAPALDVVWSRMTDTQIFDHLHLLRSNHGGSIEMAGMIAKVSRQYETFIRSDEFKSRMNLLNMKASDQLKIYQKLEQLVGSDFTIKGVSFGEYHTMLKSATAWIHTVNASILSIADRMNMTMPVEAALPNGPSIPLVEGMPSDPRVALYALEVFFTQVSRMADHLETANQMVILTTNKNADLEKVVKATKDSVNDLHKRLADTEAAWQARVNGETTFFIRDTVKGGYLRKKDPEAPLRKMEDVDLRGTEATAWTTASKRSAIELAKRLQAKYPTRQFRVFRKSIMEEVE